MFKAACIQMRSGTDIEDNLRISADYIRQAADQGANLVVTPECTTLLQRDRQVFLQVLRCVDSQKQLSFYHNLAKSLSILLVIGSIPVLDVHQEKVVNRCYVFNRDGCILAYYDKIHLFDVDLSEESFRESDFFISGKKLVNVRTSFCHLGLSICYDLRFPYLYRTLAQRGVDCFVIPAAFTVSTGQAHWKTLVRARSIETASYCLAAAQGGLHQDGRTTWGHSLIVDPWGSILAETNDNEPDILYAEIDPEKARKIRKILPSLQQKVNIQDL